MHILLWIFIGFSAFYFAVILLAFYALGRFKKPAGSYQPSVSIVIAAKNEEKRITPTLNSLDSLDYPKKKLEVILINDRSTDNTAKVIESFITPKDNWHLINIDQMSDKYHAKKLALSRGVEKAKGEIIFTTDADCRVPPGWISNMVKYFDDQTSMVLGYSPLEHKSGILGRWLDFDNLFSAIVAAAPTMLGFPISSVGRNMAFRKDSYEKIGGYESLTKFRSGDDIHLTERMRDESSGNITYCDHPATFIYTEPPSTGKEIFYQQIRKNSKILDKSLKSAAFSILLFFAYLLFFTLPLFNSAWLNIWLFVLAIKFILEFIALFRSARIFRANKLIPWFPLMQLLYPFYVVFFGILGSLHLYKWK